MEIHPKLKLKLHHSTKSSDNIFQNCAASKTKSQSQERRFEKTTTTNQKSQHMICEPKRNLSQ